MSERHRQRNRWSLIDTPLSLPEMPSATYLLPIAETPRPGGCRTRTRGLTNGRRALLCSQAGTGVCQRPQFVQRHGRSPERRADGLGAGTHAGEGQVQLSVSETTVKVTRNRARQRPTQSDKQRADVAEGDVRSQAPIGLRGLDQAQHGLDSFVAGLVDFRVGEGDVTEQGWHDGGDTQVKRAVHVAGERMKRIRLFGQRAACFVTSPTEHIQDHAAH